MASSELSNERLLGKRADRESSARSYPRYLPMAIREAQGVEVTDADGNTYYDCLAGAGTLHLGHNHPVVVEAIEDAMAADRPMHTLDITTPIKEAFVDTLFDTLPEEFAETAKIQFCSPAGTDAVEAALKLTKTATGNRSVLAFRGAYHGMTHGSLGLMGDTDPKDGLGGAMGDVRHLPYPYPYPYRCPFGVGEAGHAFASRYVERLLDDPERGFTDPAAMVFEPVQGEGGSIAPPAEWLREMRRITREHDVPLVVDEIQSGLGRTGELYDFQRADITPDVVTLSKAVGGGLPLAVVLYDERLDEWEPGAHAGTFRGNQLAMVAGKATIEHIVETDLPSHAEAMGERLREHLDAAAEPDELGSHPPDADLAEAADSLFLGSDAGNAAYRKAIDRAGEAALEALGAADGPYSGTDPDRTTPAFLVGATLVVLAALGLRIGVPESQSPDSSTPPDDSPNTSPDADLGSQLSRSQRRRTLLGLALGAGSLMIGVTAMIAMENPLLARIDASATGFGIAFGLTTIARMGTQTPIGRVSDAYGRKPLVVAGLLASAPVVAATGYVHSLVGLIALRAIQGVCLAGVVAPTYALAAGVVERAHSSRQLALVDEPA